MSVETCSISEYSVLNTKNNYFPVDMYEISGQREITGHSIERYLRDKSNQNKNIKIQMNITKEIGFSLPEERTTLTKEDIANIEIKKSVIEKISCVPKEEVPALIREGLANDNIAVQVAAIKNIYCAPREEVPALIREGLKSDKIEVQVAIAENIYHAPRKEVPVLIRECLANDNIAVQVAAIGNIDCASKEVAGLIRECLKSNNIAVQVAAIEKISFAPEEEAGLIRECLKSKYIEVQIAVVKKIYCVPEKEVPALIREGLKSKYIEVQVATAKRISYVLEKEVPALIREGLANDNIAVQVAIAKNIRYVPEKERTDFFKKIFKLKINKLLIEAPLYKDVSKKSLTRTNFEKTGSETILIGGSLIDKTIIRKIKPEAFLTWQSLYENHKLWSDSDFNYVPIEPIQSFKLRNGLVEVYSGVLDLNLQNWIDMTNNFEEELFEDRNKIIKILQKNKIDHGHTHNGNFCLRFFRGREGEIDFNTKPRIYLIDFDQSKSYLK